MRSNRAIPVDSSYPVGSAGILVLWVENSAKIGVGQNGIDLEVRLLLLDELPEFLLGLGFARTVDVPAAVCLVVWWRCPRFVNGVLVPRIFFDVEFLVRYWICCCGGGRCEDESLDLRFRVGGFEGVCDAGEDAGDDVVGVFAE